MSEFLPFHGLTPEPDKAALVAAVPYDVVNTEEAAVLAEGNPLSFLRCGTDVHEYDLKSCTKFKFQCKLKKVEQTQITRWSKRGANFGLKCYPSYRLVEPLLRKASIRDGNRRTEKPTSLKHL